MRSDAAETRRPSSRSTVHHERGHAAIFSPNDANWVAPATKTAAKRHETNTCGLVQAFEEQQANASPVLQRRTPERTNQRMTDPITAFDSLFPDRSSPLPIVRQLVERLRAASADPAGDARLRTALAQPLRQFRGLSLDDRDVLIVEGAQSGFTLIADVMLEAGDAVVCEDPSYANARAAFTARGARVLAVPIDDDGLVADDAPPARLAYVTPSHQFPLGGVMDAARRASLLAWAQRNDAYIIEDDYDSEFRFSSGPLQAIQGSDPSGRVLYVDTFSKVLSPGLPVGYLVPPPHLPPPL